MPHHICDLFYSIRAKVIFIFFCFLKMPFVWFWMDLFRFLYDLSEKKKAKKMLKLVWAHFRYIRYFIKNLIFMLCFCHVFHALVPLNFSCFDSTVLSCLCFDVSVFMNSKYWIRNSYEIDSMQYMLTNWILCDVYVKEVMCI